MLKTLRFFSISALALAVQALAEEGTFVFEVFADDEEEAIHFPFEVEMAKLANLKGTKKNLADVDASEGDELELVEDEGVPSREELISFDKEFYDDDGFDKETFKEAQTLDEAARSGNVRGGVRRNFRGRRR